MLSNSIVTMNFGMVQLQHAIDLAANRQIAVEADHVFSGQLLEARSDCLDGQAVRRRTDQHHRLFAPANGVDRAARIADS